MSEYRPISCASHELFQYAVMKKSPLELSWCDDSGAERIDRALPLDVFTRERAEYLLVLIENRGEMEIRLDFIHQARWVESGKLLGG